MNDNENKWSTESQNKRIAEWLMGGHRLTQMEALTRFRCFRLASRIHDLRERGMEIRREMVVTESGKRVAEYWVEEKDGRG